MDPHRIVEQMYNNNKYSTNNPGIAGRIFGLGSSFLCTIPLDKFRDNIDLFHTISMLPLITILPLEDLRPIANAVVLEQVSVVVSSFQFTCRNADYSGRAVQGISRLYPSNTGVLRVGRGLSKG
jgi:hypothetical protein